MSDGHRDARMKIATDNVNGVDGLLPVLLHWLTRS
jgi:hypothetical protein